MAKKEFNLSVLENVTTFDTPLKECFDYEAILSLIKEEIDIEPTEDELEYQNKLEKLSSPMRGAKRKRTYTSESVFKSPYKKKYCLKLKSPGSLSTAHKEKPLEYNYNNVKPNGARTLGTVKPRRSSAANQRRCRNSVSHSETSTFSDCGDENGAERPKKILKNGYREPIVQQNGIEFKHVSSITEPIVDSSNADDEISVSSKGESTSLATTDPLDVQTANDDSYVESSQSTQTSSELRQRLNRRRSTIDIQTPLSDVLKEDLANVIVKSEDENEHFSLTLSPSSKSSASSVKIEPTTSRLQAQNRKSICKVSPLKNLSHENESSYAKGALSASQLRQGRRKISAGSPLKGLTQELENCIRNGDYVEMCDSETESMSFTFETIQLLNDYEDCNQQANNKIFDKILSSPSGSPAENPANADNLITPKKERFIEDPLHVDYTNEDLPPSTSKSREIAKRNLTRIKTIQDQINADPLDINDSKIENIPSTSKAKNRQKGTSESELDEESQHIDDSNAEENGLPKSTAKKGRRGNGKESSESELDEESLYMDDSDPMENDSSRSEKKTKLPKRQLPARRCREFSRDGISEIFQYLNDSDTTENGSSTSSTKKKKERAKKKMKKAKKKSSEEKTQKKDKREARKIETSEDSMSMDDSDAKEDGSCKSTEQKAKISKRNSTARKRREEDETDESSQYTDDSDTTGDDSSTSGTEEGKKSAQRKMAVAKRKSSVRKSQNKKKERRSRKDEISEDESDSEANNSSDWSPETSATEMELDSDDESTRVAKSIKGRRRSSGNSENKKSVNLSESENEERLAKKAAKLAEQIAAAKKKNALSEEVYEKLLDLTIKLRHEVPPQHDVKDGLATSMSVRKEKLFLKYASLNKGKYSTAEDEIIKKNWNDFCQDHDWDPENYKPFLSLKHGTKFILSCSTERKKFVQFLANGLPNRPLFSVYKRFRLLFDKRYDLYKRYKAREDAKIIAYTTCHSPERRDGRFVELSQIMRRSSASLWKRNKTLKEKTDRVSTTVKWSLPLVEKFIRTLLSVTISDELIDLKDALLPRVVWRQMEKKMEIKWDILRKFWDEKLHVQLFAPGPILMNEIKIKLIEYMRMKNVKHSRDIRWDDLARYFDGYSIPFVRYVFNMLTTKISKKLKARGFEAMVKFLHRRKIKYLMRKSKDKCLPRICYKDKKAQLVAEDIED